MGPPDPRYVVAIAFGAAFVAAGATVIHAYGRAYLKDAFEIQGVEF